MPDRLVVDLSADARVTVTAWPEGGLPETVADMPLAWPLEERVREDLRWYLEDYLRTPFGVWEDRGPWVAGQLANWGEAVFAAVFGSPPARDAYQRFAARPAELVLRSSSPALLGLPWELMHGPSGPVALSLAGVSRALPDTDLTKAAEVPGARLRVLMVISRPAGERDVGYRMIARHLVERPDAVRGSLDLVVLRPPTLEALRQALVEALDAGEPFHVVHFDGHGLMTTDSAGRAEADGRVPTVSLSGPEGVLVFERSGDGGPDRVSASEVAEVVKQGQVSMVVLNACQSGAIGKQVEATVATRLLQEGTMAVVAMAYRIYAVAAAEFMAAFYDRLFAGETVSAAVAAGRRRLSERDRRPSPKGEMPLADWLVPIHYARGDVRFPAAMTSQRASAPSLTAELDQLRAAIAPSNGGVKGTRPAGSFVGRDDLFYKLEAALATQRVVVLHGVAGTGKTELAKAFGRWWSDTGGTDQPDGVVWHSFASSGTSSTLDSVITRIGVQVAGSDFARLAPTERRLAVDTLLSTRRLLLIWDSFETVRSMPDPSGAIASLDEAECAEIRHLLYRIAATGTSAVIITSRSAEDWLGPVQRIPVGGFGREEATAYAAQILTPYPAARLRQAQPAFGELLEWLQGHPLSMRLILPSLETTTPDALLAGLCGATPLPPEAYSGSDRDTSLAASISYSFVHLTDKTRRLLPALCLSHGVVSIGVLAIFSGMDGVPADLAGADVPDWGQALDDATRVGLLSALGKGMYQVHPALPAYLASLWRAGNPDGYRDARAAATQALVAAYDAFAGWVGRALESSDSELALEVLMLQERAICAAFRYALEHRLWASVHDIAKLLNIYWEARGLDDEAEAWTEKVRAATQQPGGTLPPPDSPAGRVWLIFASAHAGRQQKNLRLDEAERTYRQILSTFRSSPAPDQQIAVAAAQQELGTIAELRGRIEDAADQYNESLAMDETLGNRPGMAASYHQLGVLAQNQDRLDEAEDWYRKSLAVSEELGNRPGLAATYHQLGNVSQLRGELDGAIGWYVKSLVISQDLGDLPRIARIYHQLGRIAQDQVRLGEAENWYTRSLELNEKIMNRPALVHDYHQIGELAERRGERGEAEGWYRKSLAIAQDIGDRKTMAVTYHALGTIAYLGSRLKEAEDSYLKSLAIFDEAGNQQNMAAAYYQLGMVAQRRERSVIAEHWYLRFLDIVEELGDRARVALGYRRLGSLAEQCGHLDKALEWVIRGIAQCEDLTDPSTEPERAQLGRLTSKLGTGFVEARWQEITGSAIPQDLDKYAAPPRTGPADRERG